MEVLVSSVHGGGLLLQKTVRVASKMGRNYDPAGSAPRATC